MLSMLMHYIWLFIFFFFSSRRRHTRCALVTGVQTCALPISAAPLAEHEFVRGALQFEEQRLDRGIVRELLLLDHFGEALLGGQFFGHTHGFSSPDGGSPADGLASPSRDGASVWTACRTSIQIIFLESTMIPKYARRCDWQALSNPNMV